MNAVSLTGRLATFITIVMAIVIAASIALSQMIWRSMLYDEGFASCEATAADLRQVIEENLDLGIPLSVLSNTQKLIERALRADPSIASVAVLDAKGVTLFDTQPLRVGVRAPEAWQMHADNSTSWSARWQDSLLAGNLIRDTYRQPVGMIVVQYSIFEFEAKLGTSLLKMVRTGVLLLLVVIIVAAGWVSLLARDVRHWSRNIQTQVDVANTSGQPVAPGGTPLLAMIHTASTALQHCEQDLMQRGMSGDSSP
jgi:sensor histidine kinase regulating citrate/malate metabolism